MKNLIYIFLPILLFASCNSLDVDAFETLTIKEGNHRSTPYTLTWHDNRTEGYCWKFDDTAAYDLGDADQCDWNKLCGVSFKKLTNYEDALMVSWRYDLSGKLLIAPYYHHQGGTFWASAPCSDGAQELPQNKTVDNELQYIEADISDPIETHFNINEHTNWAAVTIINTVTGETAYYERYFPDFNNHRDIWPWFGGNRKAPHDITIGRLVIVYE